MADLLTTLHPINDNNTDLYPNVKRDNLPQDVKDELNAIPNKVDKVQGKGLSTNDFTNEDKALVDTIPDKVDKVTGKGLSTNDYTNADKNMVEVAIPLKISFLNTNILDLYRMVIRSGGMITVTDASVALTSQTFPLTVSPKALLNYVGGMCQKVGDAIITAPVTTVVSKGSTNIYYPIHRDIRALDGYGWGIDADCYNYIDFERKKFVKEVARIDLGSLNWTSQTKGFYASLPNAKKPLNDQTVAKLMCGDFTATYASGWNGRDVDKVMALSTSGNFNARDDRYPTVNDFKTAMTGVYLYYELATSVETDISDLLVLTFPTYDIINVLPGGYLEFENENDIGVPYSVTYQSKPNVQTTVQTIAPTAISEVDSNDPTNSL